MPEEGNVFISKSRVTYLLDLGINLREKPPPQRNYEPAFQVKEFGIFNVPQPKIHQFCVLPALNCTALGRNQEKSWILESNPQVCSHGQ